MSWDPVIVAIKYSYGTRHIIWSPCSQLIAIDKICVFAVETQILDAATLRRIKSLVPQGGHTRSLTFSAESRSLIRLSGWPEGLISWDLQTGVPANIISPEQRKREQHYMEGSFYHQELEEDTREALSITYSGCGTMFGVLLKHRDVTDIATYNVLSSASIGRHPIEKPVADMIWTHDIFIRFATFRPGSITIWEVGFTSEHSAAEVESLPIPNIFDPSKEFLFLPTVSRLAFVLENAIFVWDAQHSKLLLSSVDIKKPREMTFSSDGHFFACATDSPEIYLWKDSPTGYTLHRILMFNIGPCSPLLSPDGRSIIAFSGSALQLWHTMDSTTSISSVPIQAFQNTKPFLLGFSPDQSLAAAVRLRENTATVLDLRSGTPRLTIDAGMEIYGLRVAGSIVVVVGNGKVVTWNLPQRDHALNATANINDSVRTTIFDCSPFPDSLTSATISSDFNRVAVVGAYVEGYGMVLNIYDAATGQRLTSIRSNWCRPWFTPDGHEVWCRLFSGVQGWAIVKDNKSNSLKMEPLGAARRPQGGCPWTPTCGHKITDDGWIFNSSGKRLLWLPPHWRPYEDDRMWSGRFIAFLHDELREPVIIEVLE